MFLKFPWHFCRQRWILLFEKVGVRNEFEPRIFTELFFCHPFRRTTEITKRFIPLNEIKKFWDKMRLDSLANYLSVQTVLSFHFNIEGNFNDCLHSDMSFKEIEIIYKGIPQRSFQRPSRDSRRTMEPQAYHLGKEIDLNQIFVC